MILCGNFRHRSVLFGGKDRERMGGVLRKNAYDPDLITRTDWSVAKRHKKRSKKIQ